MSLFTYKTIGISDRVRVICGSISHNVSHILKNKYDG